MFTNILALIDLPNDPDLFFRAAIETANRFEANIHVIYRKSGSEDPFFKSCESDYGPSKTWILQNIYRTFLGSRSFLHIHITKNHPGKEALLYTQTNQIDLVLTWKREDSFLSAPITMIRSNILSRRLACPVLSLPGHTDIRVLKDIILPVRQSLPAGKLMLAVRLAGIFKATIHLVSVVNDGKNASGEEFFLKACQLLQDNTSLEVRCKLLKGVNLARATIQYGILMNSGLILVCNARKSMIQVVACLLLTRPAPAVGRIPIMTVPVEQLNIE